MKYTTTVLLVFLTLFCKGQDRKAISISYGMGNGQFFSKKNAAGGPGYSSRSLKSFGVGFTAEVSKNLYFETGLNYLNHAYTIVPSPFFTNLKQRNENIKIITLPIKMRFEAGKFFFLNGGMITDFTIGEVETMYNKYDYSGLGLNLGLGLKYSFKNKIGVFINPQFNVHNLVSFTENNLGFNETNLTFGLKYQLK